MSDELNSPIESKKRRKEVFIAISVAILFLALTLTEFRLVSLSQDLPFEHSIFFFGLVNFNIILLLFLLFLIFRNVVKIFVERQGKLIGSTLRSKLIAAFVAFSFVPTVLMLFISIFYINSSFDKWFSVKVSSVLRNAVEVNNEFHVSAKNKNYHFAHKIRQRIENRSLKEINSLLPELMKTYSLDVVEFYPSLFDDPTVKVASETLPEIPRASLEFLKKALVDNSESSTTHHFDEGNLVRVIVPVEYWSPGVAEEQRGGIVVSSLFPISLISKIDEIAAVYEDFRDSNPIASPVKTIYLVILILMTLVILTAATWFGFYLARQLATPLARLGRAAEQIAKGQYAQVQIVSGSEEISQLVTSFNQMTRGLEQSEKELKNTMSMLDEHNRYIEVILSNVSAGVVSLDSSNRITTMNRRAGELLEIAPDKYIGHNITDLLDSQYLPVFTELVGQIKAHGIRSLQKEIRVKIGTKSLLMRMTLTHMKDERGTDLGLVIVFDDMTQMINAQRAAAWREVARRIAHEIKNPLTPIKLSAQRLEKKFGEQIIDPAFQACTQTIISQVDDLKNLVNEFSQFARLPQIQTIESSLNGAIQESMVLYKTGHKEIEFQFSPDIRLPNFEFDPEQMKRVIGNLLENAVHALEGVGDGQVWIETVFDETLGIVKIKIKDNGSGITPEVRDRIFEPYFSTKKHGTGLGLAIVKRIIEDHNGFIRAFQNKPRGTEMVIELPVVRAQKLKNLRTFETEYKD